MLFIDPAATVTNTSDFTVLTVAGYSENKELIILDIDNGRYTPTEVCERLFAMCDKWYLNSVTVEMVVYPVVILVRTLIRDILQSDYRPLH